MTSENRQETIEYAPKNETEVASCSKDELERYAESVRMRIKLCMGDFFPNSNHQYASVIVKEFLDAARQHVNIYCGHLGRDVYVPRISEFERAIARGVKVRVITSSPRCEVEAKDIAALLDRYDALRHCSSELPHFVEVDGKMFRLEMNQGTRKAVVCACAQADEEKQKMVNKLISAFETLWNRPASGEMVQGC